MWVISGGQPFTVKEKHTHTVAVCVASIDTMTGSRESARSLRTFADVSETVIDSRGRGLLSHDAVHRSSTHFRDGAIYEMREQRLQMHLKWTARRRLRKTK